MFPSGYVFHTYTHIQESYSDINFNCVCVCVCQGGLNKYRKRAGSLSFDGEM